jgi:hypothetical protein
MALYTNQTGKRKEAKEKPFKLESDIQKLLRKTCLPSWGLYCLKVSFLLKTNG